MHFREPWSIREYGEGLDHISELQAYPCFAFRHFIRISVYFSCIYRRMCIQYA